MYPQCIIQVLQHAFSTGAVINGTNAQELYRSEHWGDGSLRYSFVQANGTYSVTLKFAEIYFTSTGQRIFDVAINGAAVLPNFDIVSEAGGAFTAVDRQFLINVTSGEIAIDFTGVVSNPKISAIEIVPDDVRVTPAEATLTDGQTQQFSATVVEAPGTPVIWSIDPNAGTISGGGLYTAPADIAGLQTVTVTATSTLDPGAAASAIVTLVPNDPIRVNAGGPLYADPDGQVWSADTGFGGGGAFSTGRRIKDTATPELYQTEHWGIGSLQYRVSVPNIAHTVTLKFAEIYFKSAGQRVFDIAVNGQTVLSNFDIVLAAGGAFTAVDRQFAVDVTTGEIVVDFTGVVSNPKVNAIEILP